MSKPTPEEWKTRNDVFDEWTLRVIFKLSSQGHFEELKSPVRMGKEASVFTATTSEDEQVIVKVYRLETADFKRMYDYIKHDSRYMNLKRNRRQIIFSWAQREFRNLFRCRQAGVTVPMPIAINHNVIVMSQIGQPEPAPQLKDASPEEGERFFNRIVRFQRYMWHTAGLVHSDLSAFNILNDQERPVFIDLSHAIPNDAPISRDYLKRDLRNLITFFAKRGVEQDEQELYEHITGEEYPEF